MGALTSLSANGNTPPGNPAPRRSVAYFETRGPLRAPTVSFSRCPVRLVHRAWSANPLADARGLQPALRDRSDSPTDLVLEGRASTRPLSASAAGGRSQLTMQRADDR
jgi:hypothetical protein